MGRLDCSSCQSFTHTEIRLTFTCCLFPTCSMLWGPWEAPGQQHTTELAWPTLGPFHCARTQQKKTVCAFSSTPFSQQLNIPTQHTYSASHWVLQGKSTEKLYRRVFSTLNPNTCLHKLIPTLTMFSALNHYRNQFQKATVNYTLCPRQKALGQTNRHTLSNHSNCLLGPSQQLNIDIIFFYIT